MLWDFFAIFGLLFYLTVCLNSCFSLSAIFSAVSPQHYPFPPPLFLCHRSSSAKTSLTGSPRGNFCSKGRGGGRSRMYRATVLYRQGSGIQAWVWYKVRLAHAPPRRFVEPDDGSDGNEKLR